MSLLSLPNELLLKICSNLSVEAPCASVEPVTRVQPTVPYVLDALEDLGPFIFDDDDGVRSDFMTSDNAGHLDPPLQQYFEGTRDLSNLALTCKQLKPLAEYVLYKSVALPTFPDSINHRYAPQQSRPALFMRTIMNRHDLRCMTRDLSIWVYHRRIPLNFRRSPIGWGIIDQALKMIDTRDFKTSPFGWQKLNGLMMVGVEIAISAFIIHLLSNLTSLQLPLLQSTTDAENMYIGDIMSEAMATKSLTSLYLPYSISVCEKLFFQGLCQPALRKLEIPLALLNEHVGRDAWTVILQGLPTIQELCFRVPEATSLNPLEQDPTPPLFGEHNAVWANLNQFLSSTTGVKKIAFKHSEHVVLPEKFCTWLTSTRYSSIRSQWLNLFYALEPVQHRLEELILPHMYPRPPLYDIHIPKPGRKPFTPLKTFTALRKLTITESVITCADYSSKEEDVYHDVNHRPAWIMRTSDLPGTLEELDMYIINDWRLGQKWLEKYITSKDRSLALRKITAHLNTDSNFLPDTFRTKAEEAGIIQKVVLHNEDTDPQWYRDPSWLPLI